MISDQLKQMSRLLGTFVVNLYTSTSIKLKKEILITMVDMVEEVLGIVGDVTL